MGLTYDSNVRLSHRQHRIYAAKRPRTPVPTKKTLEDLPEDESKRSLEFEGGPKKLLQWSKVWIVMSVTAFINKYILSKPNIH